MLTTMVPNEFHTSFHYCVEQVKCGFAKTFYMIQNPNPNWELGHVKALKLTLKTIKTLLNSELQGEEKILFL